MIKTVIFDLGKVLIPFDFARRIMSVVVRTPDGKDRIVSKGAPEAIFGRCSRFRLSSKLCAMGHPNIEELKKEYERLSAEGFGMERPIDDNTTEAGRKNNRRVEFHIE